MSFMSLGYEHKCDISKSYGDTQIVPLAEKPTSPVIFVIVLLLLYCAHVVVVVIAKIAIGHLLKSNRIMRDGLFVFYTLIEPLQQHSVGWLRGRGYHFFNSYLFVESCEPTQVNKVFMR